MWIHVHVSVKMVTNCSILTDQIMAETITILLLVEIVSQSHDGMYPLSSSKFSYFCDFTIYQSLISHCVLLVPVCCLSIELFLCIFSWLFKFQSSFCVFQCVTYALALLSFILLSFSLMEGFDTMLWNFECPEQIIWGLTQR